MIAKAFFQVGSEPVVDRAAVGVVGVHVAEGDAAGQGSRIAGRAQASGLQHQGRDDLNASGGGGIREQRNRNRRIQARGTEEIQQRCRHIRASGTDAAVVYKQRIVRGLCRSGRERRLPIFHQQIAARGVGVDGTIQVAAAVEVVSQAERHVMSQVLLEGQVCLLRIGINKTLSLGIAEGLEGHREECCRVQIVLIDEQVGVRRIEALLVGLVPRNARQTRTGGQDALEDVGRIQAARAGDDSRIAWAFRPRTAAVRSLSRQRRRPGSTTRAADDRRRCHTRREPRSCRRLEGPTPLPMRG